MTEHIGKKVNIPGTSGYGILRYCGIIQGKNGLFGGIELVGPIAARRGKNSGAVDGIQYFNVQHPMTGLFLPWVKLQLVNPFLEDLNVNNVKEAERYQETKEMLQSPFNQNDIIGTEEPKDRSVYRDTAPSETEMSSDSTGSKNRDANVADASLVEELTFLRSEVKTLKEECNKQQRDLVNQVKIINDMNMTIKEVHPLLEEYEHELEEKKNKIKKQKHEFDKAREEWREYLNLMSMSQQESELLYQKKIVELNTNLEAARNRDQSEEIKKYISDIDHLKSENKKLNALLQASENKETDRDLKEVDNRLSQINFGMESKSKVNTDDTTVEHDGSNSNNKLEKLEKDDVAEHSGIEDDYFEENIDNVASIDLPVYKPSKPVDPSEGRDDWCGLCERSGHSSINCPYENDIF
ncbi:Piso0_002871 [Millerozyma farinosa CBS 7064]|uniref:Piso0_002871 protein n=1 Tax=Pichia sorbitophila (strain ATCC MYA-4447 / BCRC 22081 / CBS 7064 / NBRC 10061 / NRRL Y-12695) TaxID=559304 RepID=G8YDR4_PICSO|nr:Piso0_002871 [Millerozyma farinosa CBS 7064]